MAEEIKELIAKIQQEGIKAAEDRAEDIENKAQSRARSIVAQAENQAQKILAQAGDEVVRMEKSGKASLEQAGRDLLLSLREEINVMLGKLIVSDIDQALSPGELSKIITTLIKESNSKDEGEIVIALKQKDLEKLEKGLLRRLQDEVKKGITLKPSGEISGGFIISYDGAKSHYDFTDKGIAEYLSMYLKPKLAEMLKFAPARR